jgi:hypothetical protein
MLINQGIGAAHSRTDRWATLRQCHEESILGQLSVLIGLICRGYAPNPARHAVGVTKASAGKPYLAAEVITNNLAVLPNTQRRTASHLAKATSGELGGRASRSSELLCFSINYVTQAVSDVSTEPRIARARSLGCPLSRRLHRQAVSLRELLASYPSNFRHFRRTMSNALSFIGARIESPQLVKDTSGHADDTAFASGMRAFPNVAVKQVAPATVRPPGSNLKSPAYSDASLSSDLEVGLRRTWYDAAAEQKRSHPGSPPQRDAPLASIFREWWATRAL